MIAPHSLDDDRTILRWGGLAGIAGGILFIFVFVFVGAVVGADPAGPAGAISRFPEIRALRTIENGLYLAVLVLWVTHFLALYRALRGTGSAWALFGSVLGIVGLVVLAAGALPHAATVGISDLYHGPGATPEDRATLVLLWQATQGIVNALLVTGLVVLPLALLALGAAMLGSPDFGRTYGWASVAFGTAGAGAAVALLVDPLSFIAVVGFFALIAFHLALGWKSVSLSRRPHPADDRRHATADVTA